MFTYKATIVRVVDGDTVDVMIDLGFSCHVKNRVRMYGIDTPESRTRDLEEKKRGLEAKARFKEILAECDDVVVIKSHGVGKYGRCLGELFRDDGVYEKSINQELIDEGYAVAYFGGKK